MTIEIDTFPLTYKKPLDGGAFLADLAKQYDAKVEQLREILRVYEGTAKNIITRRNAIVPASADWTFVGWAGLYICIHLTKTEGFDAVHEAYELLSWQTKHVHRLPPKAQRKHEPDPEDYPELRCRAWTFQAGPSRCTLAAFSPYDSEVCQMVEVGTQPKYELKCEGSLIEDAA